MVSTLDSSAGRVGGSPPFQSPSPRGSTRFRRRRPPAPTDERRMPGKLRTSRCFQCRSYRKVRCRFRPVPGTGTKCLRKATNGPRRVLPVFEALDVVLETRHGHVAINGELSRRSELVRNGIEPPGQKVPVSDAFAKLHIASRSGEKLTLRAQHVRQTVDVDVTPSASAPILPRGRVWIKLEHVRAQASWRVLSRVYRGLPY